MRESPCDRCQQEEPCFRACSKFKKWAEKEWRTAIRPLRRKPDRQYVIREAHKMSMSDLLNVLDGDVQIMVEFNYDTIFLGSRDEGVVNIDEAHQKRTIKAVWYSKLNSAIVIEI